MNNKMVRRFLVELPKEVEKTAVLGGGAKKETGESLKQKGAGYISLKTKKREKKNSRLTLALQNKREWWSVQLKHCRVGDGEGSRGTQRNSALKQFASRGKVSGKSGLIGGGAESPTLGGGEKAILALISEK